MRDDRFAWMKDERDQRAEVGGQRAALSAALGLRFEAVGKGMDRGRRSEGRDPRLNSLRSIFSIYLTGQARPGRP